MFLTIDDLRDGYIQICEAIMADGKLASPRGSETREILGATIHLTDPYDALPVDIGRKVGMRIAAAESLQLLGGFSDAEHLKSISANMAQFIDLGQFHGAYGPRVAAQLSLALRRLEQDPETRRAVINVWDPIRDLTLDGMANYPCTTQLQFMVRDGRLNAHTIMRANDAWHGMAYDIFCFTQLQILVASALDVPVGEYYHHATSLHLYDYCWDEVATLRPSSGVKPTPILGMWAGESGEGVCDTMRGRSTPDPQRRLVTAVQRAQKIGKGDLPLGATESEQWYHARYWKQVQA